MEAIHAEIIEQLGRVERRELTVEQFEDWFVPRTWGHRTKLAAELDHTLAEKSLLTEDQLIATNSSFTPGKWCQSRPPPA